MIPPVITIRVELDIKPETLVALGELARAVSDLLGRQAAPPIDEPVSIVSSRDPARGAGGEAAVEADAAEKFAPGIQRVVRVGKRARRHWPEWTMSVIRSGYLKGTPTAEIVAQMAARGWATSVREVGIRACNYGLKRSGIPATSQLPSTAPPPTPSQAAPPRSIAPPAPPAATKAPASAPTTPPKPPGTYGLVAAPFQAVLSWAAERGIQFDGSNVDAVNRKRHSLGLPPFVVDHTGARA